MPKEGYAARAAEAVERTIAKYGKGSWGEESAAYDYVQQGIAGPETVKAFGGDTSPLPAVPDIPTKTDLGAGLGAGVGVTIGGNTNLGGIDWGVGGDLSDYDLEAMYGGLYGYSDPSEGFFGPALQELGVPAIAGGGGWLGTAMKIGGAVATVYELAQALGLGEGSGIFGNDLLGGNSMTTSMIDIGGPGLAEPTGEWVILKEWEHRYGGTPGPSKVLHFWLTQRRYQVGKKSGKYVLMYDKTTGTYKSWPLRTPTLAVIGKNMPKHKQIVRLRKNLGKHRADADTVLRLTSPQYAAYKGRKRRR